MNKKPLEQIKNVTNVTGYRQVSLWKREDLQHPQPDELAEEVPVALVYNRLNFQVRDLVELVIFVGILSLVIIYAWKKGVFEWTRKTAAPKSNQG